MVKNFYNSLSNFFENISRPNVSDPLGILTEEDKLRIAKEAQRRNLLSQGAMLVSLGQEQFTPQRDIMGAVSGLGQGDSYVQSAYNQALQNKMNQMALEDLKAKRQAPMNVSNVLQDLRGYTETPSIIDSALQPVDTGLGLRMGDAMMQPDNVVQTPGDFIDANIRLTDPSLTDPVGLTMPQVDPLSATDINTMFPSQALTRDVKDLPLQLSPSEKLNINKGSLTEPEINTLDLYDAGFGISEDNELTGKSTPVITRSDLLPPIEQQGLRVPDVEDIPSISIPERKAVDRNLLVSALADPRIANDRASYDLLKTIIADFDESEKVKRDQIKFTSDMFNNNLERLAKIRTINDLDDIDTVIAGGLGLDSTSTVIPSLFKQTIAMTRTNFDSLSPNKTQVDERNKKILVYPKNISRYVNTGGTDAYLPTPTNEIPYGDETQKFKILNNLKLGKNISGQDITISVNDGKVEPGKKARTEIEQNLMTNNQTLEDLNSALIELDGQFDLFTAPQKFENFLIGVGDKLGQTGIFSGKQLEDYRKSKSVTAKLGALLAQYIKSISGAAVTDQERQTLRQNMPTDDDGEIELKTKFAFVKAKLISILHRNSVYAENKNLSQNIFEKRDSETGEMQYEMRDDSVRSNIDRGFMQQVLNAKNGYNRILDKYSEISSKEEFDEFAKEFSEYQSTVPEFVDKIIRFPKPKWEMFTNEKEMKKFKDNSDFIDLMIQQLRTRI